jgi:hypothetical protein
MRNWISSLDNDKSFSCFKIPGYETEMIIKVALLYQEENTIAIATTFGNVFYAQFDPNTSGSSKLIKEYNMNNSLPNK